jgi:P-type Cu+ transporter
VSDTVSDTVTAAGAELLVGGMTCGACAARIERRLNRLDGVAATVNYATGRAYFASTGGRDPGELIGVITSAGYTAEVPAPPAPDAAPAADPATRALAGRLAVCAPLAVAVIVLAMVPAAQARCSRRSPAWSARPRRARPARSGWPTGSPRCSSRA